MRTHLPTPRARRAGKRSLAVFQKLESRDLFAVINVTAAPYNAIPNDGVNDRVAIQAAINASANGDTILFDGGVFDLTGLGADGLVIPGNRTLQGINGGTIKGYGSNGQVLTTHNSNVTFYGLGFDGGGVFLDKSGGGMNQNIVFDYCNFRLDVPSGSNRSAITFTSGMQSSKVTNCYFTGYNGAFGMYGYNYNTFTIANNEFVDITAGMHIDAFSNSGNLLVEQNYMTGLKGMGMEFQSTAVGLVFQDNWYEHPNLSTTFSKNNDSFAYSLILDKSSDIQILRNVVIAPERPDGVGTRIGFEVGGDNTLVEDNYINGVNHTLAMNDGVGTASVVAKNNKFMNYLQNSSISFGSVNPSRTLTLINNGPNVTLSQTMEARIAAQQKPGIGAKRYGGIILPPTAPGTPTGLSAINVGANRIDLAWSDNSSNEDGFTLQMLGADGITWIAVTSLSANTTNYSMTGVSAGRSYSFRVTAFSAAGYSESSNTFTILTPIADVTTSGTTSSSKKSRTVTTYTGTTDTSVSPPITPTA